MRKNSFNTDFSDLRENEKDDIVFFSIMASAAVLGYVLLSKLYAKVVTSLGLKRLVAGTHLANESFSLVITVITILVPFFTVAFFEKKKTKTDLVPLGKPYSVLQMILAVPAGVAVCIAGSYVTNLISSFISSFGVTLSQPSVAAPATGYALLVYILRLTVTAALIEEICFRGIIMQPLRKYGNLFAIIASAFVFAAMHCNLIQAPAAFISGIGIGYFTVATGSVWTGILIHFVNNTIVAAQQYILSASGEEMSLKISFAVTEFAVSIGVLCFILFFAVRKTAKLDCGGKTQLSAFEKFKAYYLSIPMIVALIIIAYITRAFIII